MKLFVKFLLFLLVLAFAGQFVVGGPDGKPLMTMDKLLGRKGAAAVTTLVQEGGTPASLSNSLGSGNSDVIYKWKDKNGVWQFSQTPPPNNGNDAQKVTYNYKQNIIEAPKPAEPALAQAETEPAAARRKLIIPSSAKNAAKTNSLIGGTGGSQQAASDNPALDMLESGELGGPSLTTVPLDKLPALINQAKSLNNAMQQRSNAMDAKIDGL